MSTRNRRTRDHLLQENEELKARLREAEETLRAIRTGEVDAVVVSGARGDQVYSLLGAESVYRLVVETMKEAALTVAPDGTVLYCNTRFGELIKLPLEQIVGRPLPSFVAPASLAAAGSLLVLGGERPAKQRLVFAASDGTDVPALVSSSLLNQPDGASICIVASDLTEMEQSAETLQRLRRQQEEIHRMNETLEQRVAERTAQLQAANRTLRMISQCNEVLVRATGEAPLVGEICAIIQAGGYRMVWVGYALNDAARTVRPVGSAGVDDGYLQKAEFSWADNELGRGPTGTCIRTGTVRVCDDFLEDPSSLPWRDEAIKRGYRSSVSLPLRSGGHVFGALTLYAAAPRFFDEGQIALLCELADDLALGIMALRSRVERDRAQQVAEDRARQLRALATKLVQAEHSERRRLARVLHDHLQQLLVSAKINLAMAKTGIKSHAADRPFLQATKILDDAIKAGRVLTAELSPPVLHEKGLTVGLEWLRGQMLEKHGLEVEISADPDAEPAAEPVRLCLFDAVRELLFNTVKHAGVGRARVDLRRAPPDQVVVSVSDDGVGFDPASVETAGAAGGSFGLFSISERLRYVGGQMEVESAPGRGSRFTLTAPAGAMLPAVEPPTGAEAAAGAQTALPADVSETTPGTARKIRILVADDHPVMRRGLVKLLRDRPDMSVIGEADDGVAAIELTRKLRPDVILMDVSMPRMDGIGATRAICSEFPDTRVIGFSIHDAADQVDAMRRAGAVAYLSKSSSPSTVVAAIRRATAAGQQLVQSPSPHRRRPARAKRPVRGARKARRRT